MKSITVEMLQAHGACTSQVKLFRELFGETVDVTVEVCVLHAIEFYLGWAASNLFPASIMADYEAKIAPIRDDYRAKRKIIRDDNDAKRKIIDDDYDAKIAPIRADYRAKRKPIDDDYWAKRKLIDDDYDAKRKIIEADYEAKRAPLFAECYLAIPDGGKVKEE